jgi:hypothetical protein
MNLGPEDDTEGIIQMIEILWLASGSNLSKNTTLTY